MLRPASTWIRRYTRRLSEYYRLMYLRSRHLYVSAFPLRSKGRKAFKRKSSSISDIDADWDGRDCATEGYGGAHVRIPYRLIAMMFLIGFVGYFVLRGIHRLLLSAASMGGMPVTENADSQASTISVFSFLFYRDPPFGFVMLLRSISSVLSNRYQHCSYGWVTTAGCYGYGFIKKKRTFADMWDGCGLSPMSSGFCLCDAVRGISHVVQVGSYK